MQDLSSAVDLLAWGPLENLCHDRFASEFLSEDPLQVSGFRLAGHKGAHSPGGLGKYRSQRARTLEQRGPHSYTGQ